MFHSLRFTQSELPKFIRDLSYQVSLENPLVGKNKPVVGLLNRNFYPKQRILKELSTTTNVKIIPGISLDVSIKLPNELYMGGYELNFLRPSSTVRTYIHTMCKHNREMWILTLIEYLIDNGYPIYSTDALSERVGMPLWAISVYQIIKEVCLVAEDDTPPDEFFDTIVAPFIESKPCYVPEMSEDILDVIPIKDRTVIAISGCDLTTSQEKVLMSDCFYPQGITQAFVDETTSDKLKKKFERDGLRTITTKFVSV